MTERVDRDELIRLVSQRTGMDTNTVETLVEAFLNEIYQVIRQGKGVTLKNFGSFYVRREREGWVFKFNPSQKWRALFGWSSSYRGDL